MFFSNLFSQTDIYEKDTTTFLEMQSIEIPTLDYCIQAAIEHSPLLKASDAQAAKLLE